MKKSGKVCSMTGFLFLFFGLIFLLILLLKTPVQGAETVIEDEARTAMETVWANQFPDYLLTEFALGKLAEDGRDVASWSDYSANSAIIFLGNAKFRFGSSVFSGRKDAGTLFLSNSRKLFGYDLLVRKRGRIKKKQGYSALANGTQFSYFDLRRSLLLENTNDFNFCFIMSTLDDELVFSGYKIKVVPKKRITGDYAFRIFTIKEMRDGTLVVTQVDYYEKLDDEKPAKIQTRSDFRLHPVGTNNGSVWRPRQVIVKSANGKETGIIFTSRKFNSFPAGNLNKSALKKGGLKKGD